MPVRPCLSRLLVAALTGTALLAGAHAATAAPTQVPPTPAPPAGSPTLALGPVSLSNVPVRVCVDTTCQNTPPVISIAANLSVAGTAPGVAGPALVEQQCAAGSGLAAVTTGAAGGTVTGTLTVVAAGGAQATLPINRTVTAGVPLTLSACTTG